MDLSFSKNSSAVNDFVPEDSYMGESVELVFPKIYDFVALIIKKGRGCLLYKLDLRRAYRRISICPLITTWLPLHGKIIFFVIRCCRWDSGLLR